MTVWKIFECLNILIFVIALQIYEWDKRCDNKTTKAKYFLPFLVPIYGLFPAGSILHSHKPGFEAIKVVARRPRSGHHHCTGTTSQAESSQLAGTENVIEVWSPF